MSRSVLTALFCLENAAPDARNKVAGLPRRARVSKCVSEYFNNNLDYFILQKYLRVERASDYAMFYAETLENRGKSHIRYT